MKVVFSMPTMSGAVESECLLSLSITQRILHEAQVPFDINVISGCPYLPVARNTLVAMFMGDPDATDLFFVDADVGFDPAGVVRVLSRPEEIVAGIYPLKRDAVSWPVRVKTRDGIPIGRDGLIEAELLPTGFMRIKRSVFLKMQDAYPELRYTDMVVEVMGSGVSVAYDFFHMAHEKAEQQFLTEDYAFCRRWTDIGGSLWVYPDIDFTHVGRKSYRGNYHAFLLQQPGGRYESLRLQRALNIRGWLSVDEAAWLAEVAAISRCIVEMGSAWGRSTRVMADHLSPGSVLYALDDWKGPREVRVLEGERASLFDQFQENLGDHIASGAVVPVRCNHAALPEQVAALQPDLVFIDGDHSEASVRRDIAFWLPRLRQDGMLCGHDADRKSVLSALDALVPDHKGVPGTSLWYWTKG